MYLKEMGWFRKNNTRYQNIILGMHAKADNPRLLNTSFRVKISVLYERSKTKHVVEVPGKTTITSAVPRNALS
jgi:hypothetical protein